MLTADPLRLGSDGLLKELESPGKPRREELRSRRGRSCERPKVYPHPFPSALVASPGGASPTPLPQGEELVLMLNANWQHEMGDSTGPLLWR